MLQAEVTRLCQENIKLRTAIVTALTRKHSPSRDGEPWWWPLEDALAIPRSAAARPSVPPLGSFNPPSDAPST